VSSNDYNKSWIKAYFKTVTWVWRFCFFTCLQLQVQIFVQSFFSTQKDVEKLRYV